MWLAHVALRDVRNIHALELELSPGINVFVGRNAQGKTSLLEAVGLLARARSFRTEETRAMIRRGAAALVARGTAQGAARGVRLEVELSLAERRLRVEGREVTPREYLGRLEVAVYSSERLRVVRGNMRDRRQYLDRNAAAVWPAYRQTLRAFERVLQQRNAALEAGARELASWDERFAALGGELRFRRAAYAQRLSDALERGFRPARETYRVSVRPEPAGSAAQLEEQRLAAELRARAGEERRARRCLVGPHRDRVELSVDGEPVENASSGQARSLLLALTLAALDVYRSETGTPAVALLDDLDSELDDERGAGFCTDVAARGQALITSAHPRWADACGGRARSFAVEGGRVRELLSA